MKETVKSVKEIDKLEEQLKLLNKVIYLPSS